MCAGARFNSATKLRIGASPGIFKAVAGNPIKRVYATPHDGGHRSPKADMLAELRPVAFVDDYLPAAQRAARTMAPAKSTHVDLVEFADFWLQRV